VQPVRSRRALSRKRKTAARCHTPDLITADVRLLSGSGITAVKRILREQTIPVVFITGNVEVVRQEMPDAVVLQKPFPDEALRRAIATARAKAKAV
jgi:CheY-like chemotaxis protein